MRPPAALLAGLAAAALAAAPAGAAVVVSEPVSVAGEADAVSLALEGDGAFAAWNGRGHHWGEPPRGTEGVFVATRGSGGGWSAPRRVAEGNVADLRLATSPNGHRALLWTRWADAGDTWTDRTMLAVAPPGGDFVLHTFTPAGRATAVAIRDDGVVVAALQARERTDDSYSRGLVVEVAPDGTAGEPHVLAGEVSSGPFLRGTPSGVLAMWSGRTPGDQRHIRRIWVADRIGPASWTAPLALSSAERDADNGAAQPQLATNARGDALVVWNSGIPPQGFPGFPDAVEVARRPAGGPWSPEMRMSSSDRSGFRPSGALSPGGAAMVAWNDGAGVATAVAGPGQPFSSAEPAAADGGSSEVMPGAVDDAGAAVLVRNAYTGQTPSGRLLLLAREPGGCLTARATLAPAGAYGSTVALRGDGRGLVAWVEAGTLRIADLRQDPGVAPPPCPAPAAPAKPAAPAAEAEAVRAPALRLKAGATRVRTRDLLRRGLRVALTLDRPAPLALALVGERRGRRRAPLTVAQRVLAAPAGGSAVRLKPRRSALDKLRGSRGLTLVVAAGDGSASTVKTRRIRLR